MRVQKILLGMILSGVLIVPALAATPLTERRNSLTTDAARTMVDACMAFAAKDNLHVAIAVLDLSGDILELKRMEGASVVSVDAAPRKAKTALRWRVSSSQAGEFFKSGRNEMVWLGDFPNGGALPVIVDGETVGAIGVAGSGDEAERCARAGIEAAAGKKVADDSVRGRTLGPSKPK